MKIRQKFLTALVIMSCFFTVSTTKADDSPTEAPVFSACIEYSSQGYIVKGTFTEFPPDISSAEVLYSLDQETYQASGEEWNITNWSDGPWTDWDEDALKNFQNQTCLHSNTEPLKSYLSGKLDCFYVKLRLTRENGVVYDTQAAVIDRGKPSPVPEEITPIAGFAPSLCVKSFRPFSYYGRYQITVSEDAAPEEIFAALPDTLPIQIDLQKGINFVAGGIVDCPVAWKPLPALKLTAGESVTISDAAEEIVIAGGTMLNTPIGDFQLNESLGINQYGMNDEVKLVLNVIEKASAPTGVLACDFNGLDIAFHNKPTGATAIRAYTLSEGETEWTELPNLPLLEAVNSQPSTASSGYTYVLDNTHELYQSYMAACNEGREPTPFFIGLKIEGGVYDGQELILPWPDTYDLPLDLPELDGSGGNEDNAGAGNKGDATENGQRPNLPQETEGTKEPQAKPPQNTGGTGNGQQVDSGFEGIQPKTKAHITSRVDISPQANGAVNATAGSGAIAEASYPAAEASVNTDTDASVKNPTPAPRSAQGNEAESTTSSGKKGKNIPDSETDAARFPSAVFALVIAVLCIAGLFIAKAARKRTENITSRRRIRNK